MSRNVLPAQAVRLGAPAMLWRNLLAAAHDGLTYTLVTALGDLVGVHRGDDAQAAAALRILFDPRLAAWYGATAADASRPLRVGAAASRLLLCGYVAPCSSLGVRGCQHVDPVLCMRAVICATRPN